MIYLVNFRKIYFFPRENAFVTQFVASKSLLLGLTSEWKFFFRLWTRLNEWYNEPVLVPMARRSCLKMKLTRFWNFFLYSLEIKFEIGLRICLFGFFFFLISTCVLLLTLRSAIGFFFWILKACLVILISRRDSKFFSYCCGDARCWEWDEIESRLEIKLSPFFVASSRSTWELESMPFMLIFYPNGSFFWYTECTLYVVILSMFRCWNWTWISSREVLPDVDV